MSDKIGALWVNKEKKYMSGVIEIDGVKTDIIVFKNDYKTEEKHPTYNIFLRKKREDAKSEPEQSTTEHEPF